MSAGTLAAVFTLVQGIAPSTPADDTASTIALVIAALLGLAVLLAILTLWYWRRTDPRRAARRAGTASTGAGAEAPRPPAPEAQKPPPKTGRAPDGGITAEEWLRLTGGAKPPSGGEP